MLSRIIILQRRAFATEHFRPPTAFDLGKVLTQTPTVESEELAHSLKLANTIISKNSIKSLKDLIQRRDSDSEFQGALKLIEKHKGEYLRSNLLLNYIAERYDQEPVRVAVSGASGSIGYALLFRIASGEMLGKNQRVHLNLLELPQALNTLKGVVMELQDCAFPLVSGITITSDAVEAFDNISYAMLVGASPRTKGMERSDLLKANGAIFTVQGKALSDKAKRDVKVLVVGNPANTNALIAASSAPKLDAKCFTALTRLDHNRGISALAEKTGKPVSSIKRFAIWGNHSSTQYPDVTHTQIEGKWAKDLVSQDWIAKEFIPAVQQRGAAIIAARGASSAASAANASIDHIRDWEAGTNQEWTSMAVVSDGSYGITKGLYSSFPVTCENGKFSIVQNVPIDPFSAAKIEASHKELKEERDAVRSLLK